ncbi:hypothetical protein PAAL109150_20660 [Paenibacillus alkaliterrae]
MNDAKLYSNNDGDFSYAVDNFGLQYENPINRMVLDRFMQENGLKFDQKDTMETLERVIEGLNESELRELAYKSIGLLNDEAKKDQIKFARNLKKKRM